MNRRSLCSTGFFASVVVVLMTALAGCTDPNTMQVNSAHNAPEPREHQHFDR